jgi:predicted PhzF superfamily epimerase YddE/YHI9
MATQVPFCFVDVFASQPLTGNPLALVTDADGLTEPQMRAIAREFNQSETTFLLRPSLPGATWRLRSFTPIGVLRAAGGEGCYLYSPDPVDGGGAVAYARFFNPGMGIAEDPATGTAAGPLIARLAAAGRVPDNSTAIVEQGYMLGRPSRIQVKISGQQVQVGGSGLVVADGTLHL